MQMRRTQMTFKTILFHIDPGKRCWARFEIANRLSIHHDAHLVGSAGSGPGRPGQQDQVTRGGDLDISRYSKEELQAIVSGKAKPLRKDEDGGKAG